jgi:hypothetical protein
MTMDEIFVLGEGVGVSLGYAHVHMLNFPVRVKVPQSGEIYEAVAISRERNMVYALVPLGKPEDLAKK